MDSVRFGRALGIGARSAAKALAVAADAATAPNPSPVKSQANTPTPAPTPDTTSVPTSRSTATGPIATAARSAAHLTYQARKTNEGAVRGSKRFGEAVWGPFIKISGVLWLEITGAFFGLFALFAGQAVWIHRADLYSVAATRDDRIRAFVFLGMSLGFGYFCLSSFIRAKRKERSK